jgi:hypothetical protein
VKPLCCITPDQTVPRDRLPELSLGPFCKLSMTEITLGQLFNTLTWRNYGNYTDNSDIIVIVEEEIQAPSHQLDRHSPPYQPDRQPPERESHDASPPD